MSIGKIFLIVLFTKILSIILFRNKIYLIVFSFNNSNETFVIELFLFLSSIFESVIFYHQYSLTDSTFLSIHSSNKITKSLTFSILYFHLLQNHFAL